MVNNEHMETPYEDELIKHCEKYRKIAEQGHPKAKFKKYMDYYLGRYDDTTSQNLQNNRNIIKPIVETKVTYVLDSQITTTVIPKIISFADVDKIEVMQDIADVMNDIWGHIQRINQFDRFKQKSVRRGDITGMGIAETTWNQELNNGLGDVQILEINPMDFYWDSTATCVDNMNYCFVRKPMSKISLKEKYARNEDGSLDMDMVEKIDSLASTDKASGPQSEKSPKGVVTMTNDFNTTQAFTYGDNSLQGIAGAGENVEAWKCYLKDDSTFAPESTDDEKTKDKKEALKFKYPNGREIVYAVGQKGETKVIFEDKAIDYPFGFPIDIYNPLDTDELQGQGDVQDLTEIQDRINRAYQRLKTLVAKYVSILAYDPLGTGLKDGDFINMFTLSIENLSTKSGVIQPITNNTLSEIQNVLNMIDFMKKDAMEIARVNEIMTSGERPKGVTSGAQIEALNESPQTSIRAMQRNYKQFLISITNKALVIAQMFYNVQRMIRISGGKEFALIPSQPTEQEMMQAQMAGEALPEPEIKIYKPTGELIREIKGDLTLGEYEVDVEAASEVPMTRGRLAELTQGLAAQGIFGDPNTLEVKEKILTDLDYPGRRGIIQKMREQQEEAQGAMPPPMPPADKLGVTFRDLPPWAQEQWLMQNGFEAPPPPIEEMPPEVVTPQGIPSSPPIPLSPDVSAVA